MFGYITTDINNLQRFSHVFSAENKVRTIRHNLIGNTRALELNFKCTGDYSVRINYELGLFNILSMDYWNVEYLHETQFKEYLTLRPIYFGVSLKWNWRKRLKHKLVLCSRIEISSQNVGFNFKIRCVFFKKMETSADLNYFEICNK